MPSGKGYADFVYLPRLRYVAEYPALVVELKWDNSAESAINQIRERKCTESLKEYTESILLVGIYYDKRAERTSAQSRELKSRNLCSGKRQRPVSRPLLFTSFPFLRE